MKNLKYTIICCTLIHLSANAQWTNNPSNPQQVSNTTCTQQKVQQIPDGAGGTFVFWLDSRVSCNTGNLNDVYGQHYDSNGTALWEEDGREIIDYVQNIALFSVVRGNTNGEIIIATSTSGGGAVDSLRIQRLDDQGQKMWAQDLLACRSQGCVGNFILYHTNLNMIANENFFSIGLVATYCGGSNGTRLISFTADGTLLTPFSGVQVGNQFYIGSPGIASTMDGTGDVYVYYSNGNGSGAHASCMRTTQSGGTVWGPIDVLADTNGLNYQYNCYADETGIIICYQSFNGATGNDIFARKLSPTGTWVWGSTPVLIAGAENTQGQFHASQDDQYLYMCWADSRTGLSCGNAYIYAQKINKSNGSAEWSPNGNLIFDQCTYISYPACIPTGDGDLMVTNESTGVDGFSAQRISANGSQLWASPLSICNTTYSPFYSDYTLLVSEQNVIAAWAKTNPIGGADGIYISRFHTLANPCPEDLNGDGFVNTVDLLLFISFYGCSSGCTDGDLNGDTVVNTVDLLIFISAYGTTCQ